MLRSSPKNLEIVSFTKEFTNIHILEFKEKYPNLDINTLIPIFPISLKNVNLSTKAISQIELLPIVISVICGTLFGDSNLKIQKGYKRARLSYRHSTRQTDWFMWKTLCIFSKFINENSIVFQFPDGYQEKSNTLPGECLGKWQVSSLVSDELTKLQNIIAPNNVKTIERRWLNHMSNYFIMTLWLDDGSLVGGLGRQGIISCNSLPKNEIKVLVEYFKTVWEIETQVSEFPSKKNKDGQFYYQLSIKDQNNLMKFLRIITPILPVKSMLYKVCFFPNDVHLQQRWASELKQMVRPEWHQEIDKIFLYKKIKFLKMLNFEKNHKSLRESEDDIVQ
uniref:LAGLIDADG homing endonuclease n=1 Tax=Hydrocytium acuminatum TaxID=1745963 RepID=UPI002A83BA4B|nr:LAGLIDADG homing endonuclease [Hydrocytium acuminatum]WOR09560.1 LAGLIDADG homing endonuclease [Hydrocytium acuminatum]